MAITAKQFENLTTGDKIKFCDEGDFKVTDVTKSIKTTVVHAVDILTGETLTLTGNDFELRETTILS